MARKTPEGEPSDAQIISRLARRKSAATAAELGTTARRLRRLDGVVVVGQVSSGSRGRPALLFTTADHAALTGDAGEDAE